MRLISVAMSPLRPSALPRRVGFGVDEDLESIFKILNQDNFPKPKVPKRRLAEIFYFFGIPAFDEKVQANARAEKRERDKNYKNESGDEKNEW